MKKIITASLLFLSPVAAFAADPPGKRAPAAPAPIAQATQWGGFYVGANIGGGFGTIGDSAFSIDRKGAIGGLQAGYALQSGSLVYGVEADVDFATINGSKDYTDIRTNNNVQTVETGTLKASISSIATFRMRVGYAVDNLLFYGTGGAATSRQTVKDAAKIVTGNQTSNVTESYSEWVRGWTLGLGTEYAMSKNVSLKFEYLHGRFSNNSLVDGSNNRVNIIRTGVNYRF